MRYRIPAFGIIRSENAARSSKQPSKFLIKILSEFDPVKKGFDYGCGKLRYCKPLLGFVQELDLVDSEIQLNRKQVLMEKTDKIKNKYKNSNHINVQTTKQFLKHNNYYDFGVCFNVLSTVPFPSIRKAIIRRVFDSLKHGGQCLFVLQYRNSKFTKMANQKNATPWKDGFLMDSFRGPSFYGLISPNCLKEMVLKEGFSVNWLRLNDGSVYLLTVKK